MSSFNPQIFSQTIGKQIIHFPSINSTNSYIFNDYKGPFEEGIVVVADHQTSGRGRLDRKWLSQPGQSLLFSIFLVPTTDPKTFPEITLVASLSVSKVLESFCHLSPQIKWPNDVFINGKKCCGILSEVRPSQDLERQMIILGIGLNVNQDLSDFSDDLRERSTSVYIESKNIVDREKLFSSLILQIEEDYRRWLDGQFSTIIEEIGLRFYLKGKSVEVELDKDELLKGKVVGLNSNGFLLIQDESGKLRPILSGDVKLCY